MLLQLTKKKAAGLLHEMEELHLVNFIEDGAVLNINIDVVTQCVRIRKDKKIKTPDAIVAATALAYGYTLITNNERDFTHIQGIKIINPCKI